MSHPSIPKLAQLIDQIPDRLNDMNDQQLAAKPDPDKWSKKEIIGHLIDSASNNHHRFVRGQFEDRPDIRYDQVLWNRHNGYQHIDSKQLIAFWTLYNKHLLEVIQRIPDAHMQREVRVGEQLFTIDFLITDYVDHMMHHMKQILPDWTIG